MMDLSHILADGIPGPIIFAAIAAVLWVLSNVFGKAEDNSPTPIEKRPRPDGKRIDEIRDRLLRTMDPEGEIFGQHRKQPAPEAAKKRTQQKKKKPQRVQEASRQVAAVVERVTQSAPIAPAMPPAVTSASRARSARNETARNVRLLLQPSSVREAFLISEVLGRPKSME